MVFIKGWVHKMSCTALLREKLQIEDELCFFVLQLMARIFKIPSKSCSTLSKHLKSDIEFRLTNPTAANVLSISKKEGALSVHQ